MSYFTDEDEARILNHFTYHSPHSDQPERYCMLRVTAGRYAKEICEMCPPSRERSLALMKLEEAVMWANASIARNEKEQL